MGGYSRNLHHTIEGSDVQGYLRKLTAEVTGEKRIEVLTGAKIAGFGGYKGNFKTTILVGPDRSVLGEARIPDDGRPRGSGLGVAIERGATVRVVRVSSGIADVDME